METLIRILEIVIFIMIAYLIFIDRKLLRRVVTYKRDEEKLKINDERYYELNNKIQLLIVVSSVIILTLAFIGYDSINSIKSNINQDIGLYKSVLEEYKKKITVYDTLNKNLGKEMDLYETFLKKSIEETNRLQGVLSQLQKDYSFNVRTYMVSNIPIQKKKITGTEDYEKIRVYFKDLNTIEGKKLPNFNDPPFVSIQNVGFAFAVMIKEVTKGYFEYEYGELKAVDPKTGIETPLFPISKFDILITVNK
jgi:hypothetical protein